MNPYIIWNSNIEFIMLLNTAIFGRRSRIRTIRWQTNYQPQIFALERILFFILITILSIWPSTFAYGVSIICPQVLKTPPQSPDLNPIEQIWTELEVRARKSDIKTKSELKTVMTEEWMNTDTENTKKTNKIYSQSFKSCCGC